MNKLLTLNLLLLIIISCSEKDDTIKPKNITFDIISEDASISTLEISDFKLLSTSIKKDDQGQFYEVWYSFIVHNTGSSTIELTNFLLQAYLEKDAVSVGATGQVIPDTSIDPDGTYTVEYVFNSALLENSLNIDGYTLNIIVYDGDSEPFINLKYMLHAD